MKNVTISDSLRVSPIAFAEATTAFISEVKVASGAAFTASLASAIVYITQWHLKDDDAAMSISDIGDKLQKEIAAFVPKAKRSWSYELVATGRKIAQKLCYKGTGEKKTAQYSGVIHDIVECSNPKSALDALTSWAESEGYTLMEHLAVYTGKKSRKKSGKADAKKGNESKLTAELTSELARSGEMAKRTEDSTVKAQMLEDIGMAIASTVPDKLIAARCLVEEMDLDMLASFKKIVDTLLDRRETEYLAAQEAKENGKTKKGKGKVQVTTIEPSATA